MFASILAVLLAVLIALMLFVVVVGGTAVIRGVTLSILWSWFMVPVFGLPALSIASAIGLCLVAGYIFHKFQPEDSVDPDVQRKKVVKNLSSPVVQSLAVLFLGWIVTLFM